MDKKNKNPNVPNLRFPLYKNKWECKKIKDILKICHGKDYKHLESGKYPVLGTSGIFTYVNQYLCDWPCALIGRKGASLDKPHYMNSPFWCVDTLYYSKPVKNNNPKWQYYFFQTINWMKMNESSGIPSLRASTIDKITGIVPSYQEQSNIVEFLDKIEQRIETQIKIIKDLKMQRDHLIHSVFSSMNSKLLLITDIAEVYQPQTISSEKFDEGAEFPVFGANGIIGHYEKYNHENEQICIACRGSSVGTINISKKKSWITGNSMVINSDNYDDMIDKKFLYYQLMFIDFYKYISGSGQPQITRESLKNLKIKVPSLAIQHSISNFLNHIDLKITIEAELLCQYQLQKSYLLKNMFI